MRCSVEDLNSKLAIVSRALSSNAAIPVLSHVVFDGTHVYAYDGMQAIRVPFETDFQCAVPGKEFVSALATFKDGEVSLSLNGNKLSVKIGRAVLDFVCLSPQEFAFEVPNLSEVVSYELSEDFFDSLKFVFVAANDDLDDASTYGVRFCVSDGQAILYGTDRKQLAKAIVSNTDLDGFEITLPIEFCKLLLSNIKHLDCGRLLFDSENGRVAVISDRVQIYSNLMVQQFVDCMSFVNKIQHEASKGFSVPKESWLAIIKRASLLSNDTIVTEIVSGGNNITFTTKTPHCLHEERLDVEGMPNFKVKVNPKMTLNAKDCMDFIMVHDLAVAYQSEDGDRLFIVANMS